MISGAGEGKTQKGVKVFDASSSRKRSSGEERWERGYEIELKCASVSAFPATASASLSVSVSASVHVAKAEKEIVKAKVLCKQQEREEGTRR